MAGNHREMSSSPGLSTPPKSPESPSSGEAIVVDLTPITYPNLTTKSPVQKSNTVKTGRGQAANSGEQSAPKQPRKRAIKSDKKKEDGDAPPKQRKPRAKKQKDAQETNSSSTSVLKNASAQSTTASKAQASKQPRINEMMTMAAPHAPTKGSTPQTGSVIHASSLIGNKLEAIQKPIKNEPVAATFITHTSQPQFSSIITSRGQNYDPIRSSTIEVPRPAHTSNPGTPAQISPVKNPGRASASPSIASLINPPTTQTYSMTTSASRPSSSSATALHISPRQNAFVQQPQKSAGSVDSPRSVPPMPTPTVKPPTPPPQQRLALPTAMEIDSDAPAKPTKSNNSRKPSVSTNNSSTVPSPKQAGTKSKNSTSTPKLPPLPGTGLLSGSSLFSNGPSNQPSASGQTIIIEVPLNGETNKYINFARLAEEKYGYNALHPKLAAQRDRLARIAAAGAALENVKTNGTSADEMSLEVTEGEGEQSNADKKGSGAENGEPKKRKRQMKEDHYDKEDPFVDDTELAWEEQAAASKDGFFVYSGPLVPAGEKANIERANGTKPATGRGRGRGRGGGPGSRGGRGSRGGGTGRGKATAADNTGANGESHEPKRARGGGTTRKPRITKADRARMEEEKLERERAAQGLTAGLNPGAAGGGNIATGPVTTTVVLPKQPPAGPGPGVGALGGAGSPFING